MISTNPEIDQLLSDGAAVAMAVSGGKDSSIAALKTSRYLDSIGHPKAKRILIHSDLGSVEWTESIVICEKLSDYLNIPLVTVSRKSGGMMERWLTRWRNNVARYTELLCAKLILPWSTPSMRFCTSELKTAIICSELTRQFPGQTILNVVGIRRAESDNRKNALLFKPNNLLTRKNGTRGFDWLPIVEMETEEVFLAHREFGFPLHEAYRHYGSSRVSCVFCIMGNKADLIASSKVEEHADIYREMCELELTSAFAFQSSTWLSDVAPHLLTFDQQLRRKHAKWIAGQRLMLEKQIPTHLLYKSGKPFPQAIPTLPEARFLSSIRKQIGRMQNFEMKYIHPVDIIERYTELRAIALTKEQLN